MLDWARTELEDLNADVSDPALHRCQTAAPGYWRWLMESFHGTPTTQGRPNKDAVAFTEALKLYQSDWRRLSSEFPKDLLIVRAISKNVTAIAQPLARDSSKSCLKTD